MITSLTQKKSLKLGLALLQIVIALSFSANAEIPPIDFKSEFRPSNLALNKSRTTSPVVKKVMPFSFEAKSISIPMIEKSGTVSGLVTCKGTASATGSFTVWGMALMNDITVTAPAGFEVSKSPGDGFGSSTIVAHSYGEVPVTTIYVRIASTTDWNSDPISGDISLTSLDAETQYVNASGTVNSTPAVTFGTINSVSTSATSFIIPITSTSGISSYSVTSGNTPMPDFVPVSDVAWSIFLQPTVVIPASGAGTYSFNFIVKSDKGCTMSTTFNLVVNPSPVITSQPSSSTFCAGGNASFSTVATNASSYQWQENSGSGFANITNGGIYSNATTATLNITGATAGMHGNMYRCIVTGSVAPAVTSNGVTLTLGSAPIITQNPSSSSVTQGNTAQFSITASNATGYQWQINDGSGYTNLANGTGPGGEVYSGVTSSVLSINNTTTAISGNLYRCIASGNCSPSATSTGAIITVTIPTISSATYNASTGALIVTGSGFLAANGDANDIVANKFTFTGEGGSTYTSTDTSNPEITSATLFTITLSPTDKAAVNRVMNKNGTSSTGGTTYNLAAAEDWAAGVSTAATIADMTGNSITVSNVAIPAITSATYDASTGVLVATGTGFLSASGAVNDIIANKFIFSGEGGDAHRLSDTPNSDITSGTSFTLTLSATDRSSVNLMMNKNGTQSTAEEPYNLSASEDWAAGADGAVNVADGTGNGITVSNVAVPAITSATYNASTGTLVVTGTGFLSAASSTNDITANKLTFTGTGGAGYTLTTTSNVEITSHTSFTLTLSLADKTGVNLILNKNGTSSTDDVTYNLAAAEDWAAGADANVVVADLTGNGITASNVDSTAPVITSVNSSTANATYKVGDIISIQVNFSENVMVTGTPQLTLETGTTDQLINNTGGTSTAVLTFNYTVTSGNNSADLDYISANALALNGGTIRDASGNNANLTLPTPGAANSLGNNKSIVIDGILPTVSTINRVTTATTNASSVNYQVTFSEPVTGVDIADFSLSETGTASGTLSTVTAVDASTYTVSVKNISGDGLIRLDLKNSGTGIRDLNSNAIATGYTSGQTYTFDNSGPIVTSVTLPGAGTYAVGSDLDFIVNFSENVLVTHGLIKPGIVLAVNTGGPINLSYHSGSNSSSLTFRYTIADGITDDNGVQLGALVLGLGATIKDLVGNNIVLTLNNIPSTAAIRIDALKPTATIVVADAALITGETSLVTITFSEAVTGFDNADLTIANGTLSAVSSSDVGTTWTATFTPTASITDATNLIILDKAGVSDGVGNAGSGTTNSNNYTIDTSRPTASIVVADNALKAGNTSLVTITFSEAVTGFANADLTIVNGTLGAVSSSDGGTTWTATFTPTASVSDATNQITLDNTGVADAAGNAGIGTSVSNNYSIETLLPTLSSITIVSNNTNQALAKIGDSVTISISSSKEIILPAIKISGQLQTVTGSGKNYTASYSLKEADAEGLIPFEINYTDLTGNTGIAASATTDNSAVTYDRTAPASPANFAAQAGNTEVQLSWTENTETDIKEYRVYAGNSANPNTLIHSVPASAKSYTHTGLTNGLTYYYRITAVDNAGNLSAASTDKIANPFASQLITFNAFSERTYGDDDFDPGASSNSGQSISYTSDNSSVATIVAGKIHITGVGTARITASQSGNGAFATALSQTQTLTVNKKNITLTLNASPAITKVYDGLHTANLSASNYNLIGIESGDVVTISGSALYEDKTGGAVKTVTVNNLILGGTQKDNYQLSTTSAITSGSITPRTLTVTAADATKFQGSANPAFSLSYSGFVGSEKESDLSVQPILSTNATISSPLGSYPINVSGGVSANYSFNYLPGTLTVITAGPASLVLTGNTLYENQPSGTTIGTLSSSSIDPNTTFTFALASGNGDSDNNLFAIQGNSVRTSTTLNFEQKSSYSIRVRAGTQHGFAMYETFTINLKDVNEAPTLAVIADQAICYTANPNTLQTTGATAGPEPGQSISYAVSSDNASLFEQLSINSNGRLTYQVKADQSGTANITVTVTDNGGKANGGANSYSRSFSLTVNPLPLITISSNNGFSISKGENLELTASGGTTYSWNNPGGVISGQQTATLTIRPERTTSYQVTVTTAAGCVSIQNVTIEVKEDYLALNQTNVVTPNGDGVNDNFVIKNADMYPNNTVKIYDQAGRLMFSKTNYTNEWDGTLQGSPLAEGTYYYTVDFGVGKPLLKGYITIVRD